RDLRSHGSDKLLNFSICGRGARPLNALELHFGIQTLQVAMDHGHGELASVAQVGDGTILLFNRTVDLDLVPIFGVTDIGDSEVMLFGPEEGYGIESLLQS